MSEDSTNLIYEHVPFERRWMNFQRVAWLILSLALLGAVFGVFGRGAYARQTSRAGSLQVTYDKVLRSRTMADLQVRIAPEATSSGQTKIILSGAVFRSARLYDVLPKPTSEEAIEGGAVLTFKTIPGKSATVLFTQKVDGLGSIQSHVSLDGNSPLALDQFILP